MKKVLITMAIVAVLCNEVLAQSLAQTDNEWMKPVQPTDIVIGEIECRVDAGEYRHYNTGGTTDSRRTLTDLKLYEDTFSKAKRKYGETYPQLKLRSFKSEMYQKTFVYLRYDGCYRYYDCSATVVMTEPTVTLSHGVNKALRNVQQGSRIAIDQISVSTGFNWEEYNDKVIDILLEKGYRVVAKEYLQKLYEEQKDQESGLYNPDTTVEGNKFSAVGYFINVKVTETSIRVQVVNVSTGEYEGNATINF